MQNAQVILKAHSGAEYLCGDYLGRGGTAFLYAVTRVGEGGVDEGKCLVKRPIVTVSGRRIEGFFRAETRALLDLCGLPGVCQLFDHGTDSNDLPFLIMEHVLGETFAQCFVPESVLPLPEFWDLAISLAEIVGRVHEAGWIHRDLKMDNIIKRKNGTLVLLDFGLALPIQEALTLQEPNLGSCGYMAPEQVLGGQASQAVDIYALGCLFLRLITGVKTFSALECLHYPVPRLFHGQVLEYVLHSTLQQLIGDMLSLDPQRRPSDADVLSRLRHARST